MMLKTGRKASHATAMRSASHTSGGIAGSSFALKGTLRNLRATMPPAQSEEAARKVQANAGLMAVKKCAICKHAINTA